MLDKETLDERDAYAAAGFERPEARAPDGLAKAARLG
jgi:hypothetical protein